MKDITFTAYFGNAEKLVTISQPHGSGEGGLQLTIGGFYKGVFLKRSGKWEWCPQDKKKDDLTSDDIQILIDRIKKVEQT